MRYLAVITLALLVLTGCQTTEYGRELNRIRPLAELGDAKAQSNLALLEKQPRAQSKRPPRSRRAMSKPAFTPDHRAGVAAYKERDYAKALRLWRPLAEQGHARAQNRIGMMYRRGLGVTRDYAEAIRWWRKAAGQGHHVAQNNLARLEKQLYRNGYRPPRSRQALVRRTQEALQVLGLYSGKLDGIIGVITKSAIQRWQRRNGYSSTGQITKSQLTKLEQEAIAVFARKKIKLRKQVTKNLPKRPDDVAVIIANSNYKKLGKGIPNVEPAYNDAKNIKKYFTEELGVREGNIINLKDATGTQLSSVFGTEKDHKGKLFNWTKPNVSKVYVYYAGHGAPAGKEGTTYLVPSDADSETVQLTGYPMKQLYNNLGKVPATSITVILEACFSGQSQGGYLSSQTSGLRVVPKMPATPMKITVISAGTANQVASWEKNGAQSLFTKFFLKSMAGEGDKKPYGDENGKVSLKELKKYLDSNMTYFARRYYGRTQTAQIVVNGRELLMAN